MLLHILYCWVVGSYLAGLVLLVAEVVIIIRQRQNIEAEHFGFMALLFLISPLTAWHGVLHYVALGWSKLIGKPFQPWI
jgi:hypothetical protein